MSSIKAFECLTGHISGLCTLSGKLTCFGSLSGKLSAVIDFNAYSGEYEVVPNAFNTQVLPTANKVLKKDIVVQKVPYFETSNNYDGVTVYIAEEEVTIPQGFHDGSGKVGIDATEKGKLIANNIREGVTILGVEGTMSGSENMKPQAKTVTPSTAKQTILPDTEYNCLSQVEVEAIPYVEADNPAGGVTVTIAG